MPMLRLQTSPPVPEPKVNELVTSLSTLVSEVTHKPEKYVMIVIESASILMSGKPGPAALADVRGIGGLNASVNRDLTQRLCKMLESLLGIPADRVYVTFTELQPSHWGWNSSTFA